MSEKLYARLLRLFPARFRSHYGDEAMRLFRDRSRDEQGFLPTLRLWLDLLADLAVSLPSAYRYGRNSLAGASVQPQTDGVPSFRILTAESPRVSTVFFGSVLSLIGLAVFAILLEYAGGRHFRAAETSSQPSGDSHRRVAASDSGTFAGRTGSASVASGVSQPAAQTAKAHRNASSDSGLNAELVDAAERRRVIAAVLKDLNAFYLFPDVAQKMTSVVQAHQNRGDYNAVVEGGAFASLLTMQLRAVSHDKHLHVDYSRFPTADRPPRPSPDDLARYRSEMTQSHCTFEKISILPENIGYIKLDTFPDPAVCESTAAAAMARLNHVNAIIYDLRDNGGGFPAMVAFMAGYLFDRPTHLNDMVNARQGTTQQFWTQSPVPGNRLANKPAYVLTSVDTFSGAEEFSYDLKMLKRATLVGETTAGGANAGGWHRIDAHFGIAVPEARPVNPVSKTNWEGKGVQPDVRVSAASALPTAEKLAAASLHNK